MSRLTSPRAAERFAAPAYLLQLRDDLDRLEAKSLGSWSDVVIGLTSFVLFTHVVLREGPILMAAVFAVFSGVPLVQWVRAQRERRREMRAIRDRIDRIEGSKG